MTRLQGATEESRCFPNTPFDGVGRWFAGEWFKSASGEEDGREDGGPASNSAECKGGEG